MAAVRFQGAFRIVQEDANQNVIAQVLEKLDSEFPVSDTSSGSYSDIDMDPQKFPKVKKHLSPVWKEDDYLTIRVKPSQNTTVDVSDTHAVIRIPVTFKNVRTGIVYEKTLEYGDFTDLIASGSDVTLQAGTWYDWLRYRIPAQSALKLGHAIQDVRVDSALLLQWDTNVTT